MTARRPPTRRPRPKARAKRTNTTKATSQRLEDIIRELPGFDPYAHPGGAHFDNPTATRAIAFFHECLQHIDGRFAGTPFKLSRWQIAIVANLFGWLRPDGARRFREALLLIPRGNGKTPLAAGICLYGLFCDRERGAQIYSAAADREQAAILYRHARGMVEAEPMLDSRAKIYKGTQHRSITLLADEASVYRVLSSDADTKHGFTPHIVVCDELHAWPNRNLWDVFTTAFAKRTRRQPLLLAITTADYDRPGSICNEKVDYAEKVCTGVIDDPSFLPVLYRADPADDPFDEKTWAKANPNLDITVDRESLRRSAMQAQEQPTHLNEFLRLHLNVRTQTAQRWIDLTQWDACAGQITIDPRQPCFAGLDMSTNTDLTALAIVWPAADGWHCKTITWIPRDSARQREKRDKVPYETWVRLGHMRATDGVEVDYDAVRRDLNEIRKTHNIRKLAIDRWNATQLAHQLQGDGFDVVAFGQGYASMSAPTKELERLIIGRRLTHDGNPVTRWAASNAVAEMDAAGNIKLSKGKSVERIDPIITIIMALGLATAAGPTQSIYAKRGMLTL